MCDRSEAAQNSVAFEETTAPRLPWPLAAVGGHGRKEISRGNNEFFPEARIREG
jgi:hypothetical protein